MQSTPRIAHDTGKPTKFSLSDLDGTHWLRSDMMEVHVRGDEACIGKQKSKLKVSKDTMTCEGYELTHSTDIRLKWVHPEGHVIYWHKDGAEACCESKSREVDSRVFGLRYEHDIVYKRTSLL